MIFKKTGIVASTYESSKWETQGPRIVMKFDSKRKPDGRVYYPEMWEKHFNVSCY